MAVSWQCQPNNRLAYAASFPPLLHTHSVAQPAHAWRGGRHFLLHKQLVEQRSWPACQRARLGRRALRPQCLLGRGRSREPLETRVISTILSTSTVPYSSYVSAPRTFLHSIHASVKLVWLVALLVLLSRASPGKKAALAAGLAGVTVAALPARLWRAQLTRLGLLTALILAGTALGADGIPPVLQTRGVPAALEGLPACAAPGAPYRYVLLHLWFVTITRRSVSVAVAAAALTFTALQSASLCLVTSPPEEVALAVAALLRPLAWLRLPVREVGLTLLLALRFMALVFEEVRNLAAGVAARGLDWRAMGPAAGLQVGIRLTGRLFGNLMQRSENIAVAMHARGFAGPEQHRLYQTSTQPASMLASAAALLALSGLTAAVVLL